MNLPVEVIDAIRNNRCVVFVGSRASLEAAELADRPYPDNKELATRLGWKKPKVPPGGKVKGIIPSVEEGAATYEAQHGRAKLVATLKDWVGAPGKPTSAHELILKRFPLIFSTATDTLFEQAAATTGVDLQVLDRSAVIPSLDTSKRVLVRLRGNLEQPDSLLLTPGDFAQRALNPDQRKTLRTLIRNNVVFFVGYRPDEEEFERIFSELSDAYGGELPRCHLAVAQGAIDDFLWQKWVWRGLLLFMADPTEACREMESQLA